MRKIIDFHAHTFEKFIADKALDKLSREANVMYHTDGTDEGLRQRNADEGIELSVVIPVATRKGQAAKINARNVLKNEQTVESSLLFFAAIHPQDDDIEEKLKEIKRAGFKGIKLHPVYQDTYIDSKESLHLIDKAEDLGLITVIHAGEDISFPGKDFAAVPRLLTMLEIVKPEKIVLAHMGGYNEWDAVISDLAGANVYFDTAFCINEVQRLDRARPSQHAQLPIEKFLKIVKLHGAEKIVFGTDSPWTEGRGSAQEIIATGLSEDELELILYENARKLLGQ